MISQLVFTNLIVYLLFQLWQMGLALKDWERYDRVNKNGRLSRFDRCYSITTLLSVAALVIFNIWS